MPIIVDTSILIDHLRGHDGAQSVLFGATLAGEELAASVLTRVEVLAGMRPAEAASTFRLLDSLEWIPVDDGIAQRAGELANRYLRSHPGVDTVDFVIAATVERLAATLLTRNVKHFPMFPGLRPPY